MSVDFSVYLMSGYEFVNTDIKEIFASFFRMISENEDEPESELKSAIDSYYMNSHWYHDTLNNCTSAEDVIYSYVDFAYDYFMDKGYMVVDYDGEIVYIGDTLVCMSEQSSTEYSVFSDIINDFEFLEVEFREFLRAMFPTRVTAPPRTLMIPIWS